MGIALSEVQASRLLTRSEQLQASKPSSHAQRPGSQGAQPCCNRAGTGNDLKVYIAWDVTPVAGDPAAAPAGPSEDTAAAAVLVPATPLAGGAQDILVMDRSSPSRSDSAPIADSNIRNSGSIPRDIATSSSSPLPPAPPGTPETGGSISAGAGSSNGNGISLGTTSSGGSVELRVYVGVKWTGNPISQVIVARNTMAKTSASQQALVAAAVRWLGQPSERRTLQDVMPGAGTQPGAWGQDTTGHAMGLHQAQKSGPAQAIPTVSAVAFLLCCTVKTCSTVMCLPACQLVAGCRTALCCYTRRCFSRCCLAFANSALLECCQHAFPGRLEYCIDK